MVWNYRTRKVLLWLAYFLGMWLGMEDLFYNGNSKINQFWLFIIINYLSFFSKCFRLFNQCLPSIFSSYEERNRSLDIVSSRHKESNTFEEFTSRVYAPISRNLGIIGSNLGHGASGSGSNSVGSVSGGSSQLAAALIDHHHHQSSIMKRERELTQHTITISSNHSSSTTGDHPSPRPSRKLHHPFKSGAGVKKSSSVGAANIGSVVSGAPGGGGGMMSSPPESPTMQPTTTMRKFR